MAGFAHAQITQISIGDCLGLQELYANKTANMSTWDYHDAGTNSTEVITNCNCTTGDRPTVSEISSWAEVTGFVQSGVGYVQRLLLNNEISTWVTTSHGLFDAPDATNPQFQELRELTMGSTGLTTSPSIDEDALPELTYLSWLAESNMTTIPDLSQQTGSWFPLPSLKILKLTTFSGLGNYANSNVPELSERSGLTYLSIYQLDFSDGNNVPFDDIFSGSRTTLTYLSLKGIFDEFSSGVGGQWYHDALIENPNNSSQPGLPELRTFIYGEPSTAADLGDLEPNGEVFNESNFEDLTYFNVNTCGFTGTIPGGLFVAPGMERIYISNNNLEGFAIPDMSPSSDSDVEVYEATGNDFSDTDEDRYADFQFMPDLTRLRLDGCQLHCPLVMMNLSQSSNLTYINFNANELSGPIPGYYGNFPLTEFYVQSNYLTYCPELTFVSPSVISGYRKMNIASNYFSLDDIYRATKNSKCDLVTADNQDDNYVQMSSQRERVLNSTRTIDLSAELIGYGSYGQDGNFLYNTGAPLFRDRNSIITLVAQDALDPVLGDAALANAVDYEWHYELSGSESPAQGNNSGASYAWEDYTAGNSGATWFCKVQLKEPTGTGCTSTDFYSEIAMEVAHTTISFNTSDPCSFNGSAGSAPNAQNDRSGQNTQNTSVENVSNEATTNVSKANKNATIAVYPNPANDLVTIESSETIQQVQIRDLSGRVVSQKHVEGSVVNYPINELDGGTYFIQFRTESGWSSAQIVKTK